MKLTGTNRSIGLIFTRSGKPNTVTLNANTKLVRKTYQYPPTLSTYAKASVDRQLRGTSKEVFDDPVLLARGLHPIPSRTRP